MGLFPSFFHKPKKSLFVNQDEDEYIELFLRQHWISLVPPVLTAIFLTLAPLLLQTLIYFFGFLPNFIDANTQLALTLLWGLLIITYLLENLTSWYFNIFIVTNKHLVDIGLESLLAQSFTQIQLKDVESAEAKSRGILSSYFNFGDVEVETAAKDQSIKFEKVPNSRLVADIITSFKEQGGEKDNDGSD